MTRNRVIRHERVDVDVLRARDARQLWRSHLVRRRVRVPVSWFGRSVVSGFVMSTCRGCAGTGHVSPRYAFAGICTRCWGTGNEPAPKTENHNEQEQ